MLNKSIISSKLKPMWVGFIAVVLVLSQIAMSHAMASMPNHGVHSQVVTLSISVDHPKSSNSYDLALIDMTISDHNIDMGNAIHDEQSSHCVALCMTALVPLEGSILEPLSTGIKYLDQCQVYISEKFVALKRPPRT